MDGTKGHVAGVQVKVFQIDWSGVKDRAENIIKFFHINH